MLAISLLKQQPLFLHVCPEMPGHPQSTLLCIGILSQASIKSIYVWHTVWIDIQCEINWEDDTRWGHLHITDMTFPYSYLLMETKFWYLHLESSSGGLQDTTEGTKEKNSSLLLVHSTFFTENWRTIAILIKKIIHTCLLS